MTVLALMLAASALVHAAETPKSWAADNGNGTYSNPGPAPDRKDGSCFRWKVVK